MGAAWYSQPWTWAAAGTCAAAFVYFNDEAGPEGVRKSMANLGMRGKRITKSVYVSSLGIVTDTPESLRAAASEVLGRSITNEVYAAARMIRSEGAAQGEVRLHVAFNDLKTFRWATNIFQLLTYSTDPKRKGLYGAQYSGSVPSAGYVKANARRYSTIGDPYESDVALAEKVIAQRQMGIDKALGAVKFIDKSAMGGVQPGTVAFSTKNAEWIAGGYTPFTIGGHDDLVLYRVAKKA